MKKLSPLQFISVAAAVTVTAAVAANDFVQNVKLEKATRDLNLVSDLYTDALYSVEKSFDKNFDVKDTDIIKSFDDILLNFCSTPSAQCKEQVKDAVRYEFNDSHNRRRERALNFLSVGNDNLLLSIIHLQRRIEMHDNVDVDVITNEIHVTGREIEQSKNLNEDEKEIGRVIVSLAVESTHFWNEVEKENRHPMYFSWFGSQNTITSRKDRNVSQGNSIRTKNAVLATLDTAFKSIQNKSSRKLLSSDIESLLFQSVPASFNAFRILQEEYILDKNVDGVLSISTRCEKAEEESPQWFVYSIFDMIMDVIRFILRIVGLMGPEQPPPESKCVDRLSITNHIVVNGKLELSNLEVSFSSGKGSIEITENGNLTMVNCTITDTSHCPDGFTEIDDMCYHVTENKVQRSQLTAECESIDTRSFVPLYDDIRKKRLGHMIRSFPTNSDSNSAKKRSDISVWISGTSRLSCASVDPDMTLTNNAGNCVVNSERRVLCAAKLKNPIRNNGHYVSELSTLVFTSHMDLARHVVDKQSVPSARKESNIKVWKAARVSRTTSRSEDFIEGNVTYVESTMPDQLPTGIKVNIDLVNGDETNLKVASDTHGVTENNTWSIEGSVTLPTKIHLHATDEVCVSKVALVLLDDEGGEHETVSVSVEALSNCLDYNVCSEDNEEQCGRSLMYYDKENKCAVLNPSESKFPRDLSLSLHDQECLFLTSWSHSEIGEGFLIEVTEANQFRSKDLQLEDLSSEVHRYNIISSGEEVSTTPLNECNQLPLSLTISTESESVLKGVKILRYNNEVSGVSLSNFFNCSSLCDILVNSESIILNQDVAISKLTVDLFGENDCAMLSTVQTMNITGYGDENGEMACTDPSTYNISNVIELSQLIDELAESTQYKSVNVLVPESGLSGPGTVNIVPHRRLVLETGNATAYQAYVKDLNFVVPQDSKMYSNGIDFKGNVTIEVQTGGLFELDDSTIEVAENHMFLINHGNTSVSNVFVLGSSKLSNEAGGYLDLTHVNFEDESMILTSNDSFLSVARILLHENIDLNGNVSFTYAARQYALIKQEENNCDAGDVPPSALLQVDMKACLDECDKSFYCSGALWWIDDNATFHCDLCLQEDNCSFDCTHANSYFLKPEEKLNYTVVDGCLYGSREMRTEIDLTFSECRLYCSYFKACGGINFWTDDSTSTCTLYADVDFATCAAGEDEKRIYLDFNVSYVNDYGNVNGELIADKNTELAIHPSKDAYECSSICSKTIHCESFVLEEGNCVLYDGKYYEPAEGGSPLYISVTDAFPKKRFMNNLSKQLSGMPLAFVAAKTKNRCMKHCNDNYDCIAFSYESFSLGSKNCVLYDETATLIESTETSASAQIGYGYDAFVPTTSTFIEEEQISGVHLEECKTFCLNNAKYIALQYFNGTEENNNTDSICYLGEVELSDEIAESAEETNTSSVPETNDFQSSVAMFLPAFDENATYVLSAISFHFTTRYENTRTCLSKEILENPSFEKDISMGYARFERACVTVPSNAISTDTTAAPATCANLCDNMESCDGYVHYRNYNGVNNLEKDGICEFITSDDISFHSCDGTENNMDIYIRGDIGLTCEAACSVDPDCVSYVFDGNSCELYSNIGLLEVNDECDVVSINVKTDHRSRGNMMTVANNTCLVDTSLDTGEIGCYGVFTGSSDDLFLQDATDMSPQLCKTTCADQDMDYYAITNGDSCYCYDSFETFSNLTSANCTSQCTGDAGQICGGPNEATIGETLLPISNVTQIQCMDACLGIAVCLAATYNEEEAVCQLHTVSATDVCPVENDEILLQKSCPGRFYEKAESPYSFRAFHSDYKPLKQDCEKLCIMFDDCDAIRYDDSQPIHNCELLEGNFREAIDEMDVESDIWIARRLIHDAIYPESESSLTRSLSSENVIASYPNVYHFDQCSGLCSSNIKCGSFVYQSGSACTLFDRSQSFKLETSETTIKSKGLGLNRYVSVKELFDDSYFFSTMPANYCVSGGKTVEQPKTIASTYACGVRCYEDEQCGMFTTTEIPEFKCWFHYSGTISTDCDEVGKTLYSLQMQNDKIVTSNNARALPDKNVIARYNDVSLLDCVGICQKSESCKSCSHDKGVCSIIEDRESTYQEGTFKFRPVNKRCISETNEGRVFPKRDFSDCLTLCSRLNDIGECDTFEHSIDGDCTIYADEDGSCKSSSDDGSSSVYTYVKGAQAQSTGRIMLTDIDGQFQQWLSTNEGHNSMSLRSDNMAMENNAEINIGRILDVLELVDRSADAVEAVYVPVDKLTTSIKLGKDITWAIGLGCQLIQYFPYVGPVARVLGKIFNKGNSVFKKGYNALKNVPGYFERVLTPLETFSEKLESSAAIILRTMKMITDSIDTITRGLFFSRRSGNTSSTSLLTTVVNTLSQSMRNVAPTVSGLSSKLSILDGLSSALDSHITRAVDGINRTFGGIFSLLDSFKWLQTVIDYTLYFDLPYGFSVSYCWWVPCGVSIRWKTHSISIRKIGGFIDDIKSFIMSIPLVGWLWGTVEGIINTVINAIFAGIGIEIPSIGLNVNFLDNVKNDLARSIQDLTNLESRFSSFLNVQDIQNKMNSAQNTMTVTKNKAVQIKGKVNEAKTCTTGTCFINKFGAILEIIDPGLGKIKEKIMPVDKADFTEMKNFFTNVDSKAFYSAFSKALEGGIVCDEGNVREVADIDYVKELLKDLNLEGLRLPTVPIPFASCNSYSFANEDEFRTSLTTIFNNIAVNGATGGGYQFRMPVPTNYAMPLATKYSNFISKVTRNVSMNKDKVTRSGISKERTMIDVGDVKVEMKTNNAFDYFDVIVGKSSESLQIVSPPFYSMKLTFETTSQDLNAKFVSKYGLYSSNDKNDVKKELQNYLDLNLKAEMQQCYSRQLWATSRIYDNIVKTLLRDSRIKNAREIRTHVTKYNNYSAFKNRWKPHSSNGSRKPNIKNMKKMESYATQDWAFRNSFMEIINFAAEKGYSDKRNSVASYADKTARYPDDDDKLCSGFSLDELDDRKKVLQDVVNNIENTIPLSYSARSDERFLINSIAVDKPWFKFLKKVSGHAIDERKIRDPAITVRAFKKYYFGDLKKTKTYTCSLPSLSLPMNFNTNTVDEVLSNFGDTFSWLPECLEYRQETKRLDAMNIPWFQSFSFRASKKEKRKSRAVRKHVEKYASSLKNFPILYDEGFEMIVNFGDIRLDVKSGGTTTFADNTEDDYRYCSNTNSDVNVLNKFCINYGLKPFTPAT